MALVFAWRPDDANLYARYSSNGKAGGALPFGAGPTRGVDAGAIGGFSVACAPTLKSLGFRGANFVNGSAFSILLRVKASYSGAPSATRCYFYFSSGHSTGNGMGPYFSIVHQITTGNVLLSGRNEDGSLFASSMNLGVWSPTSGNRNDLILTCTGTTAANGIKFYVDGVLLGQGTASLAIDNTITSEVWKDIILGASPAVLSADTNFEEFVIWDTVIDPTANVNLESGLGLLNGASRTSFVSDVAGAVLTSYDGLASTGGSTHSSSYSWSN